MTGRSGVYVPEGSQFRLTDLRFSINDESGPIFTAQPEVSMDLFPVWSQKAIEHTSKAATARQRLLASEPDTIEQSDALVVEMTASMEASAAVGFALDALYASIDQRTEVDDGTRQSWALNDTPRPARVGYVIRRGFRLSNAGAATLDSYLSKAYQFRDWVVHSPADFRAPQRHPDLGFGIEWRFVAFRYANVYVLTKNLLAVLGQLPDLARESNDAIITWSTGLRVKSAELDLKWVAHDLRDPNSSASSP